MKRPTLRPWAVVGWVLWLALFFVLEIPAVVNDVPGDAFSELLWWLEALPGGAGALFTWIFAGVLLWLTQHVLRRGRWWG